MKAEFRYRPCREQSEYRIDNDSDHRCFKREKERTYGIGIGNGFKIRSESLAERFIYYRYKRHHEHYEKEQDTDGYKYDLNCF